MLPEGAEPRVLKAAETILRRGVADLTLLGAPAAVRGRIADLKLDAAAFDAATIEDPATSPRLDAFAAEYHRLREHKGVTPDVARDRMTDVSYYGTMLVHLGLADGMVSGSAHTTAHTIRPAFEFVKTKPGVGVVSGAFLMCLADRVLVYADCAVVPEPTADQLAEIAVTSADTAARFGVEPRVALLSYSTGESGSGEDVDRVREATAKAKALRPDLPIDGPIQYDAAVDPRTAAAKRPGSPVAGKATVLIFPDLNTGNNTYKAVQRTAGAVAVGPVLQGLNKPVNDLSRGCTVADILNTVAITAIQAQAADRPRADRQQADRRGGAGGGGVTVELLSGRSPLVGCSYLPEERARMGVKLFAGISGGHYAALLARGWRRQGATFFRSECPACKKCRSLRVDVRNFRPTKSQRRCRKKNAHIRLEVRPAGASDEHAELYNRWHADMHDRRGWGGDSTTPDEYRRNLVGPGYDFAKEFAYYDGDRLIGVGLVDDPPGALNSIYFFHDPAWRPLGPGTFSALSEIQYAAETGRDWVYLGYWIPENASMAYKNRFAPHELLTERVDPDEPPPWRTPGRPGGGAP